MKIGIKGHASELVTTNNTAKTMGSGTLQVYATPALTALMEKAASESVSPFLEEGTTTVGVLIHLKHLSASPLEMTVTCESELVEIDGRKLIFKITATDGKDIIGEAEHERFIVKTDRFMDKAQSKLN